MANRRCLQSLTRCFPSSKTLTPFSHTLSAFPLPQSTSSTKPRTPSLSIAFAKIFLSPHCSLFSRHFSYTPTDDDEDSDESDDEAEETEIGDEETFLSPEDKDREADEIGYKVMGPLLESDLVFKPCEPIFDILQLILNKVLMLGSKSQTIIGRPILPDAAVHAVVEEHALDAKVIIFKKKRRKNYRRTKGHRQELTKLRITDIQGIEKPEKVILLKTKERKAAEVGD